MKSPIFLFRRGALLALAMLAATGLLARATVTMELDKSEIQQGDTAQLTIHASGSGDASITAPSVPGLQFTATSQSTQVEIINGSTTTDSTTTYDITSQAPGTYAIPLQDASGKKLVLHVIAGPVSNNTAPSSVSSSASAGNSLPAPAVSNPNTSAPNLPTNGGAFLRMDLPKRPLYVGETIPVKIEMGLPAGSDPTLDGLPSLTGDAFTLNDLSDKPEQSQVEINGRPYLLVTWESALAAIKPGDFSLAITAPVTVRMRVAPRRPAPDDDDNSPFGSFFNDPFFQNFMGRVVQKDLTLSNRPETIHVLPLPTQGQPADFSGAVGQFEISSTLTPSTAAAGDPMTLRLQVKGQGSFDRVDTAMLNNVSGWKTYPPTTKFTPGDSVGYSGEKDFEQAVIALHPGHQQLPALSFTFFNPETRQYETRTSDIPPVDISPGAAPLPQQQGPVIMPPSSVASAAPSPAAPSDGLRPDEAVTGTGVRTLLPLYFQPGFVVGQGVLALAFIGASLWLGRRERLAADQSRARRREDLKAVQGFLAQMDAAAANQDARTFFLSARQALQHCLAWRWNMSPGAVTMTEIDAHLNGGGENIRQVFTLADQLIYSGHETIDTDFAAWKRTIHQLVKETETL